MSTERHVYAKEKNNMSFLQGVISFIYQKEEKYCIYKEHDPKHDQMYPLECSESYSGRN